MALVSIIEAVSKEFVDHCSYNNRNSDIDKVIQRTLACVDICLGNKDFLKLIDAKGISEKTGQRRGALCSALLHKKMHFVFCEIHPSHIFNLHHQ